MFSYAGKSEKEIEEYRKKSREEYDKKYKGRIDENNHWLSPADATAAVFDTNAQETNVPKR